MNNSTYGLLLFVVILLIVILSLSMNMKQESFCGDMNGINTLCGMCSPYKCGECDRRNCHEWGYPGRQLQQWNNQLTMPWVGPNPRENKLEMWQYNPKRSLVDYRVYEFTKTPELMNTSRLETTAHANIGKDYQCPSIVPDPFGGPMGTRTPDDYSTPQYYSIPQTTLI